MILKKRYLFGVLLSALFMRSYATLSGYLLDRRVEDFVSNVAALVPQRVMASGIISNPGYYLLANDVFGQITIDSDFVTLSLNGHSISGGENGILVKGRNNVSISSGSISGVAKGIVIDPASMSIELQSLTIQDCVLCGTDIQQSSGIFIKDVNLSRCPIGLLGNVVENMLASNCASRGNTVGGFMLYNGIYNQFIQCVVANIAVQDADVYGFVSVGGKANIFSDCVAENMLSYSDSDTTAAAGFTLKYPESLSAVQQCFANRNLAEGAAYSFGITLSPGDDSLYQYIDQALSSSCNSLAWHPSGNFLAFGGPDGLGGNQVRVYRLNLATNNLVAIPGCSMAPGGTVRSVAWSLDGQYLAVAGDTGVDGNEVRVYAFYFDGSDYILVPISAVAHGATVNSVSWALDGKSLAIGGAAGTGGYQIRVYASDYGSLSLLAGCNQTHGATVNAVAWHNDGLHLATGGDIPGDTNEVRIWSFDGIALTQIVAQSHGAPVHAISWTPHGFWLAIGGDTGIGGHQGRVYRFNVSAATLTELPGCDYVHGASVYSVMWSLNSTYLAIGGDAGTDGYEVRVYKFLEIAGSLSNEAYSNQNHGASVMTVAWRFDGQYLAFGGDAGIGGYHCRVSTFNMPDIPSMFETTKVQELPASRLPFANFVPFADAWDPTGDYVALAGRDNAGSGKALEIAEFDSALGSLSVLAGTVTLTDTRVTVAWHPGGQYVAVGGNRAPGNAPIVVYKFDSGLGTLTPLVGCMPMYLADVTSVAWSPDGAYLAVGSAQEAFTLNTVSVYSFNAITETLTIVDKSNVPAYVYSVSWHPSGEYLAVGSATSLDGYDLHVFYFDSVVLSNLPSCSVSVSPFFDLHFLAWHPSGSFLACAGSPIVAADTSVAVYQFDLVPSPDLTELPGCFKAFGGTSGVAAVINGIAWSPDGTRLSVGAADSVDDISYLGFFLFDNTELILSTPITLTPRRTGPFPSWRPDGKYIAITATNASVPSVITRVYSVSDVGLYPAGCIVQNNVTSNNKASGTGIGTGLLGLGIESMIASNRSYQNDLNYAPGVGGLHSGITGAVNTFQNVALPN